MTSTFLAETCTRIQEDLEKALSATGLRPHEPATDEAFLRDCYIDILARCPTPQEISDGLRELKEKTRDEYRYWLANHQAAKEACLNRSLVASLHAEMVERQRQPRDSVEAFPASSQPIEAVAAAMPSCDASCDLLQLLYGPIDDRAARIRSFYRTILNRPATAEEIDGWMRLQGRGMSDSVLLWAFVQSEERVQGNPAVPAGLEELAKIVRKQATFKELMLLNGNALLELACQMFLKREAQDDDRSYYAEQIAKGWSPSDALWKTVSRRRSATFRSRRRMLWKSIRHPLTTGRWHVSRLLQFHVVRRMASTASLVARGQKDLSAQIDSVLQSHTDSRKQLADLQLRQESFAGQFVTVCQLLEELQRRQESSTGQTNAICRTLLDLQHRHESLEEQCRSIQETLVDVQQRQEASAGQYRSISRTLQQRQEAAAEQYQAICRTLQQQQESSTTHFHAISRALAEFPQRRESVQQFEAVCQALSDARQRQEKYLGQSEAIARTLVDLQQQSGRLENRAEAIHHSVQCQEEEQKAAVANKRWPGQLVNDNVVLVEHPYTGVFGIPAENWGFVRMFTYASGFERGTMSVLASLCQPGMTVVDIGAHVGLHSLVLARRAGPQGRLYCFEPGERCCKILRNNLFINDCNNAIVRQTAISDSFGTTRFFVHDRELTWSSLYPLPNSEACTEVCVETARLDDVIPLDTKVDLVKIDAEGAELTILNGMQRVIAQNPAIQIVMEFGPSNIARTGKRAEELVGRIHELGFSIRLIDESNGQVSPVTDADLLAVYSVNLLLSK
jgi:FkbM family methyltransferase